MKGRRSPRRVAVFFLPKRLGMCKITMETVPMAARAFSPQALAVVASVHARRIGMEDESDFLAFGFPNCTRLRLDVALP